MQHWHLHSSCFGLLTKLEARLKEAILEYVILRIASFLSQRAPACIEPRAESVLHLLNSRLVFAYANDLLDLITSNECVANRSMTNTNVCSSRACAFSAVCPDGRRSASRSCRVCACLRRRCDAAGGVSHRGDGVLAVGVRFAKAEMALRASAHGMPLWGAANRDSQPAAVSAC